MKVEFAKWANAPIELIEKYARARRDERNANEMQSLHNSVCNCQRKESNNRKNSRLLYAGCWCRHVLCHVLYFAVTETGSAFQKDHINENSLINATTLHSFTS